MLEKNDGQMMIFISDVWLDQPKVSTCHASHYHKVHDMILFLSKQVHVKLNELFDGFHESNVQPIAFIFMGNFQLSPFVFDASNVEKYTGS